MDCCYGLIFSLPHIVPSAYIPKDSVYHHSKPPGVTEGNITSCEAQAYLILFGMIGLIYSRFVLVLNSFLSRKGLSNCSKKKTKFFDIVIFCLPILLASGLPSFFLYYELLNPTPYNSTCFIGPYPYECLEENIDCIRGDTGRINTNQFENVLRISSSIALSVLIVVVLLSIKFIPGNRRIFFSEHIKEGREPQRNEIDEEQEGNISPSDFDSSQSEPPNVALAYSLAFLISWITTLIVYIEGKGSASQPMKYLSTIFQNLQSFQTMIIFLFFETWLVRHSRNAAELFKWQEALKIVVSGRHHEADIRKSYRTSVISGHHYEADIRKKSDRASVPNVFEQQHDIDPSLQSEMLPRANSETDNSFSLRPSKASTCCSNSTKSKYDQSSILFPKNFKFYDLPSIPPSKNEDEEQHHSIACLQPIFEFPMDQFEVCRPLELSQVEEEP
ncbi:predicted protein [Chaetoceros tenuissimus]|uniref:Uncharacterized protein n=1 Tax=Chaetoceros tenuissimus TaxID=426638 RepID=A0AAD3DAJ5_9STRA|nr:predicted protein [Chaetoceros tenuissimus]